MAESITLTITTPAAGVTQHEFLVSVDGGAYQSLGFVAMPTVTRTYSAAAGDHDFKAISYVGDIPGGEVEITAVIIPTQIRRFTDAELSDPLHWTREASTTSWYATGGGSGTAKYVFNLDELSGWSVPAYLPPAGLSTTITLVPDVDITPTASEVITFGLPLSEGDVQSTDEIKVEANSIELPIAIRAGLTWHWSDGSLRSVIIQLQNMDMTAGNVTLQISKEGRNTANDLSEVAHSGGWATAGADKDSLPYPRIFALHQPSYLATAGLIPPYSPMPEGAGSFSEFISTQFDSWAGGLDYSTSINGNWLFDRSSAMYKAYMSTGDVKYLKEAFLSKQFYFTYVKDDGDPPAPEGGDGCFTYDGVVCADGKYIAPQQAKLALALNGDDSQWDLDLIKNMALQADIGWNQHRTRDIYDSETEGFTERAVGLAGLAELVSYEMTGDATVLSHMNERIASLKDMQQTEKAWDIANGWTPKSGAFTHSFVVHEGVKSEQSAPTGVTDDRAFSPWMSENIADFLWQAYQVIDNQDIPEMLRLLGNAVDLYGFTHIYDDGAYLPRTLAFTNTSRANGYSTERYAVDPLYFGSAYASDAQLSNSNWWPWYTDGHSIEMVLPLSLAYYFENDANARQRLMSRIDKILTGYANTQVATNTSSPMRLFNWQHRSNSVGTWYFVSPKKVDVYVKCRDVTGNESPSTSVSIVVNSPAQPPLDAAADPVFNYADGSTITINSQITITSTLGVPIYYTIDGSTPTDQDTLYNDTPFTLGDGLRTVRAIAVGGGYSASGVTTVNYTVILEAIGAIINSHTFGYVWGDNSYEHTIAGTFPNSSGNSVTISDNPDGTGTNQISATITDQSDPTSISFTVPNIGTLGIGDHAYIHVEDGTNWAAAGCIVFSTPTTIVTNTSELESAVNNQSGGDLICIEDGTYTPHMLTDVVALYLTKVGTTGARLRIAARTIHGATVDASSRGSDVICCDLQQTKYYELYGLRFLGGPEVGVLFYSTSAGDSEYNYLYDCLLEDGGRYDFACDNAYGKDCLGAKSFARRITVERCTVKRPGPSTTGCSHSSQRYSHHHGIYVYGEDITIKACLMLDCMRAGYAFSLCGYDGASFSPTWQYQVVNCTIGTRYSDATNWVNGGIFWDAGISTGNNLLQNNAMHRNDYGADVSSSWTHQYPMAMTCRNNYATSSDVIGDYYSGYLTESGSVANLATTGSFTNPDNDDYSLVADSDLLSGAWDSSENPVIAINLLPFSDEIGAYAYPGNLTLMGTVPPPVSEDILDSHTFGYVWGDNSYEHTITGTFPPSGNSVTISDNPDGTGPNQISATIINQSSGTSIVFTVPNIGTLGIGDHAYIHVEDGTNWAAAGCIVFPTPDTIVTTTAQLESETNNQSAGELICIEDGTYTPNHLLNYALYLTGQGSSGSRFYIASRTIHGAVISAVGKGGATNFGLVKTKYYEVYGIKTLGGPINGVIVYSDAVGDSEYNYMYDCLIEDGGRDNHSCSDAYGKDGIGAKHTSREFHLARSIIKRPGPSTTGCSTDLPVPDNRYTTHHGTYWYGGGHSIKACVYDNCIRAGYAYQLCGYNGAAPSNPWQYQVINCTIGKRISDASHWTTGGIFWDAGYGTGTSLIQNCMYYRTEFGSYNAHATQHQFDMDLIFRNNYSTSDDTIYEYDDANGSLTESGSVPSVPLDDLMTNPENSDYTLVADSPMLSGAWDSSENPTIAINLLPFSNEIGAYAYPENLTLTGLV